MAVNHDASRQTIDWEAVRTKVLEADRRIEDPVQGDDHLRERILRERAVQLAKPVERNGSHAGQGIRILEFILAGGRYGIETRYVRQVYPMMPLTFIPGLPDYIVGIIAPEGEVLSVVDLRSLLNLPLSALADPKAIMVLQEEKMAFGILTEQIVGVETHSPAVITEGWKALGSAEQDYLKGVTPERTGILDAQKLLSDPRLVVDIS